MNGWWWLIAAFVLAGIELLVPGWAFMGLAASVGLMGVLMLAGLWSAGLPVTLVMTALLSSLAWLVFRRLWPTSRGIGASGTATSTTDGAVGRPKTGIGAKKKPLSAAPQPRAPGAASHRP